MKSLFQILLVFVSALLFNTNGSSFLYAHTSQTGSDTELVNQLTSSNVEKQCNALTLQSNSFPTRQSKSEFPNFSFFEKEEKEKEDKFTSLKHVIKVSFDFTSFLTIPLHNRFYNYDKNYLHVSESLNYFLSHKCYILFQVFRL